MINALIYWFIRSKYKMRFWNNVCEKRMNLLSLISSQLSNINEMKNGHKSSSNSKQLRVRERESECGKKIKVFKLKKKGKL